MKSKLIDEEVALVLPKIVMDLLDTFVVATNSCLERACGEKASPGESSDALSNQVIFF